MSFKEILSQLNVISHCKKQGLPLRQCPQLLFLIMGIVIMISAVVTYTLGTRVADPQTVLLIVLALTVVLFVITFSITRSLEGLAEANRLKSEFVSVVSHQLRSPLSNLKWALEFLMSDRLGKIVGKQAEYFKILKDNTARMGGLVSDLLTVSRIEQGRLPLKKTEFSLQDLTKEIISELEPQASAANVAVKLEVSENLPKILADRSRIKLVAENFLDNAIRYIKGQGEVVIKIGLKNKSLLFSVKDNGVGIPKGDQKHIFQKFFRSKNVLKYQTQGSGLGLYIAKSIIERSKGKIGFKSQENKGSTFYFTIPIK
ncbi:Adaptive-response sensory-kinase SasA [subsurface metagenome]